MKLTERFDDCFKYESDIIYINMAFDNILRMFELFDDEALMDYEKVYIALEMLTGQGWYNTHPERANKLFLYIMKEFLDIDLTPKEGSGEKQAKFMDYTKDAELIFASFFAVYGMDLYEWHGKLHWKKFQALLSNLDDESPLKKIIGYRTMKIPEAKKGTEDYRKHVLRMKERYSLDDRNPEEQMNDMFSSMFRGGGK